MVHPGVHFKAVEGDALPADAELGEGRAHLPVKAVAVHTQVGRGVAEADQAGLDLHRLPANPGFKAALMAVFADLFQLVAQISHSVVSFGECF